MSVIVFLGSWVVNNCCKDEWYWWHSEFFFNSWWKNLQPMLRESRTRMRRRKTKAAYCIQSTVDSENFDKISHVESTKETCDNLVKYYEGGDKVKVVKLQTLFKIRYKHYRLRYGRNIVVPTSSRANETRLVARSLGRTLKSIRSMIRLMNPWKRRRKLLSER